MTDAADIVVVGAGVVGTSIAMHLADLGARNVVLIDRAHVAAGMSSRSSALVRMHYTLPEEVLLALRSLEMFNQWEDITGSPSTFHPVGFLRIVPPSENERLRQNVAMQRSLGVDTALVNADELRELEPEWAFEDVSLAAYEPSSGYGDGATTAGDMLGAARAQGVRYLPNTPVHSFLERDGRVYGVRTQAGEIHAAQVVCAAGVWSPPLLEGIGVALPIVTEYHHTLVLKAPPHATPVRRSCIDSATQCYFRPQGPDMTIVGEFTGPRGGAPDAVPSTPDDQRVERILGAFTRRVPGYQEAGLAHSTAGVYDMTPDQRPMLGPVPGHPGLHVAIGFSGQGFKISPAVGRCVAEWVLQGRPSTVDVSVLRADRFELGGPIVAPHEYELD